jgi:hypothetical protein
VTVKHLHLKPDNKDVQQGCDMSQHTYAYDHPTHGKLEITAGWDRPLGYSFLVVVRLEVVEDEDEILYSNLDDEDGPDVPPPRAAEILERLECPIPEGFIADLELDRFARAGPYDKLHQL